MAGSPWTALKDQSSRDLVENPELASVAPYLTGANDTTTPGCDVLRSDKIRDASFADLNNCFNALRRDINNPNPNPEGNFSQVLADDRAQKLIKKLTSEFAKTMPRDQAEAAAREQAAKMGRDFALEDWTLAGKKRNALHLKSAKEKAFLGLTLACYGEATPSDNNCDRELVMLTLQNRVRVCNQQFPPKDASSEFQALDAALQPKQFSMFNTAEYLKYDIRTFEIHTGPMGKDELELVRDRLAEKEERAAKKRNRAPKEITLEMAQKRAKVLQDHLQNCIEAFKSFALSNHTNFTPRTKEKEIHFRPTSHETGLPFLPASAEEAKRESERRRGRDEQPNLSNQIMYYHTLELVEEGKIPEWTDFSTITDLSCKIPGKVKLETASNMHLVFADDWDCSPLRRWRFPNVPLPPNRPDSFEPADGAPNPAAVPAKANE